RIEGKTVENEPVDGVWRIAPNRVQQWESSFQGKPLIVNGRLHGRELPWSSKCASASQGVTHEARTEVLKVPTATLTDRQFLTGDGRGPSVTISGELRIPKSTQERRPAVVLLHGSGGIARNVRDWAAVLNAEGIATLSLDSFTGRGLRNIASNQASLGRMVQ